MRVGIVNDLAMAVHVLRRIVSSLPGYEVAWTAADGAEAVRKCAADKPDVVLMDLLMPVMDGVEATRAIMQASPCAILVVTASVTRNAAKVFDAMGAGALDAVATPVMTGAGSGAGAAPLVQKLATIGKLLGKPAGSPSRFAAAGAPASLPLVAIGASTGGPGALATVLAGLRPPFGASVVIIQHVDVQFAGQLAAWLNDQTQLPVAVAEEGVRPEPGRVFVAATNDHLVLSANHEFQYTREPAECLYRPSADAFFHSLVRNGPRTGIGVLLTGMGRDGALGLQALRRARWHTIAQDEKSSVVWGMPRAAVELGAAEELLPLGEIAAAITARLQRNRL